MTNQDDARQSAEWFTSSYSNDQGGQCVQAARLARGKVRKMAVRDSKNPEGPAFAFGGGPWMHFINAVTEGEITDGHA